MKDWQQDSGAVPLSQPSTPLGPDFVVALALMTLLWLVVAIRAALAGWKAVTPPVNAPAWWPFGQAAWAGQRRGTYVLIPLGGAFIATGWLAFAASHGVLSAVPPVAAAVVVLVLVCTMLSITVFNRPRFAVPPSMRSEHGAVESWFSRNKSPDSGVSRRR